MFQNIADNFYSHQYVYKILLQTRLCLSYLSELGTVLEGFDRATSKMRFAS